MLLRHSFRISLSFVSLSLLVIFVANALGLIPDRSESIVRERINLSETLAVLLSEDLQRNQPEIIPYAVKSLVDYNKTIKSILVKKSDGDTVTKYGNHPDYSSIRSTSNLIKVPLFKDNQEWGIVELRFTTLHDTQWWNFVESTFFQLVVFIALLSFVLHFLLVRKVLIHLDPYKTIPTRVKSAFNAVSDGMVFVDEKERIVLSNDAFEKRFNYKSEDLIGKKLSTLPWYLSQKSSNEVLPWQKSLTDVTGKHQTTLNYPLSDNETLTLNVGSTSLFDSQGHVCGALASFSDVTDLERMNFELENMTQFLRHEMSNALIGATGTMALIEQQLQLNDDGKELVHRTQRLLGVIKYLLDSVKEAKSIESSFSPEDTKSVRLDLLLADIVNSYSIIYTENEFLFESDNNALVVSAHEERLIQMIDKLKANAIDYSIQGTPVIFSTYRKKDRAVIKVVNQGAVLPENKQKIFDLYSSFQDKNANQKNQGIGLFVVKLIAEGYGGSVKAEDRQDIEGAEFIIELPLLE